MLILLYLTEGRGTCHNLGYRAPVAGTVSEGIRYFPGAFVNAAFDKASTHNERCAYSMRDADGNPWTMVQIAGLARRIVCRVDEGDALARGNATA